MTELWMKERVSIRVEEAMVGYIYRSMYVYNVKERKKK